MIVIVGTIEFDPNRRDELLGGLRVLKEASKEEPGCLRYEIGCDPDILNCIHVQEAWSSEEALKDHLGSQHFTAFMSGAASLGLLGADIDRHAVVESRPLFGPTQDR